MRCFLYILKSKSIDKYYVGISQSPKRRLEYHNSFEKGFTSRYRPWEIVFTQMFLSKEDAAKMENKILEKQQNDSKSYRRRYCIKIVGCYRDVSSSLTRGAKRPQAIEVFQF